MAMYPEITAAQWISNTYITDDSKLIAAKSNERFLTQLNSWLEQAKRFEGKEMSPQTARAINLLKIGTAMPPPKDPAKLAELTRIATRSEEHTSELQSLMRHSYAVFCLKKKKQQKT